MYLNTHTYYSLRYGTFCPKTLVEIAKENQCTSIALTDINSTSACLPFIQEAKKKDIKPIIGVDFRNGAKQQYIALAKNNKGFQNINAFLSELLHSKKQPENIAPELENTFIIYPFQKDLIRVLKTNEYIGFSPVDIPSIHLTRYPTEKGVILQTVSFRTKKDFNTHRLLRAIGKNTLLSKLSKQEEGNPNHKMLPVNELVAYYTDFPEIIANTKKMIESCSIDFKIGASAKPQNQQTYTGCKEKDLALLYSLCEEGLDYRYPKMNEEIEQRIEKELTTIIELGFVSYFLINWDIVKYARSQGYFYVGRGSGANSVIAYILRITDVDPIELDLYFERFINLYRSNPPDFDIDFSWKDREDITRYIFNRFQNVALVATYNTFQRRGVIRELGKVFGLPKEEIDLLSKGKSRPNNHLAELVLKYGEYIYGFPNTLSVHSCGILISEKPIHHFTATFMPPKGYPTIHFDMHVAEDVGLYKFDILSQRGLSKIKDALEIINYNQPLVGGIDIHNMQLLKSDKNIKTLLREAKSIGCFYVESPAMRMLMTKLHVDDYLGLVAASSVIRPGVAKSGMMQEYIKRLRDPEKRKDAHPTLLDLMPETFGVMVYQEDVIKVAHYFAGLSLGEADKMRRGMSGKFRSKEEFDAIKDKFFQSCENKGHTLELTSEIWRQTESFAGYAFAKGHSASYAVESYQCLFLKAYYPLEFMVATINNYGGFYRTELYMIEAKIHGGIIQPPCVNNSSYDTVIQGKVIFLGYHLLHQFEIASSKKITDEKQKNGVFLSFNDFIERVPISLEQIALLIRINAFRFTGKNKRELLWEAHFKISKKNTNKTPSDLFRIAPKEYTIPPLSNTYKEDAFDEIELLGFTTRSMFNLTVADKTPSILANELIKNIGKKVIVNAYLIHIKKTATNNGKLMFFGTFIDRNNDWVDTVHFPITASQYPPRGPGIYTITGVVTSEYDFIAIEVESFEKMAMTEDPRYNENSSNLTEIVTDNSRKVYWENKRKSITK